jgi:hypothetical protein
MISVQTFELNPLGKCQRLARTKIMNPKLTVIETPVLSMLDECFDFLISQNWVIVGFVRHVASYWVM